MEQVECVRRCPAVIVLGFPVGSEFGIDMQSWNTGELFMGIKLIPPGIHMLHYSLCETPGAQSDLSPRCSFYVTLKQREVLVLRWRADSSTLEPADEEETRQYAHGFYQMDFDKKMAPYPMAEHKRWVDLTDYHTKEVVERVRPVSDRPISSSTLDEAGKEAEAHEKWEAQGPTCKLFFTPISFSCPPGLSPGEVTTWMVDKSGVLERAAVDPMELVGELQMAFVLFLVGQNYSGFEQWKTLLQLFLSCERAMKARENEKLFVAVCKVVARQLSHIPPDFFHGLGNENSFLAVLLNEFHELVAGCSPPIQKAAAKVFEAAEQVGVVEVLLPGDDPDGPTVVPDDELTNFF